MAGQFIVLAVFFAVANAGPVWIDNGYIPDMYFRTIRTPNVAFGFGSGFSSNIGGISHSTGISSSFQSGDAQAYGASLTGAKRNVFAKGIGYANAAPWYPFNHQEAVATSNNGLARSYAYGPGAVASSAQNFGNFGSSVTSAQAHGGYGSTATATQNQLGRIRSAVATAHSFSGLGYGSAVSSATTNGLGYGSAVSSVQNVGNFRSAVSSVQGRNGFGNYGTAVSAAQNYGGYRASTAQTSQQHGPTYHNSGASSINGPSIQAAQSHAVNT